MPKKTAAPESVRYLRTITGRSIPGPPPLLLGETNQAASKSANAIQEWLWRQAIIEAASRCDCGTTHGVSAATITYLHGGSTDRSHPLNLDHQQTAALLEEMTLERDKAVDIATRCRMARETDRRTIEAQQEELERLRATAAKQEAKHE